MKDEIKVEYEYVEVPDVEQRIFRALSMLISYDDLYGDYRLNDQKPIVNTVNGKLRK